MKKLLKFIVKNITDSEDFKVEENQDDERVEYEIVAKPSLMGMIIGKKGKTIRSIRNLARVKATLDKKIVSVSAKEE